MGATQAVIVRMHGSRFLNVPAAAAEWAKNDCGRRGYHVARLGGVSQAATLAHPLSANRAVHFEAGQRPLPPQGSGLTIRIGGRPVLLAA